MNDKSLYSELIRENIPVSNWQSDLYFPVTKQTTEILKRHPKQPRNTFKSIIDGQLMYECNFAFDPFWQKLGAFAFVNIPTNRSQQND